MCWSLTFVGLVAPKGAVGFFLVPKRTVGLLCVITASLSGSRHPAAVWSSCGLPRSHSIDQTASSACFGKLFAGVSEASCLTRVGFEETQVTLPSGVVG